MKNVLYYWRAQHILTGSYQSFEVFHLPNYNFLLMHYESGFFLESYSPLVGVEHVFIKFGKFIVSVNYHKSTVSVALWVLAYESAPCGKRGDLGMIGRDSRSCATFRIRSWSS
jgi:hypothetical protein